MRGRDIKGRRMRGEGGILILYFGIGVFYLEEAYGEGEGRE